MAIGGIEGWLARAAKSNDARAGVKGLRHECLLNSAVRLACVVLLPLVGKRRKSWAS